MGRNKKEPGRTPEMLARAIEWQRFRTDNKLSQKFLAEIIGVSRRTVQNIEAGILAAPHKSTLDAFEKLRAKYESEGKSGGRGKHKSVNMQAEQEF